MAGQKKISEKVPSLNGWGGVRSVQRRLERSATIVQNREAVAYQLLAMGSSSTRFRCCVCWRRPVGCWMRRRITRSRV